MDFASSTRAAEFRTRWKDIIAKSSLVSRRPSKVTKKQQQNKYSIE